MEKESEKLSDYDILDKAYKEIDKGLLLDAINRGINLNIQDNEGMYLWEQISWIFPAASNASYFDSYVGSRAEIERTDLFGFMRLALDNGMNLNAIGDDMGHKYAPLADLIDWCRYPEFLSFLVKNGADVSLQIDDRTKLLDELDFRYWFCQLEFYEGRGIWLSYAIDYLKRWGAKFDSSELHSEGDNEALFYPAGSKVGYKTFMPDYSYKGFHGKDRNG